ncbi:hypothetical protein [Sphingomonas sp. ID0503]|uniref:hypothetical protein n=1 Tax=Sphingomonas sp. ID0503 TaxID=3399691 RepID=UPI003AFA7B11
MTLLTKGDGGAPIVKGDWFAYSAPFGREGLPDSAFRNRLVIDDTQKPETPFSSARIEWYQPMETRKGNAPRGYLHIGRDRYGDVRRNLGTVRRLSEVKRYDMTVKWTDATIHGERNMLYDAFLLREPDKGDHALELMVFLDPSPSATRYLQKGKRLADFGEWQVWQPSQSSIALTVGYPVYKTTIKPTDILKWAETQGVGTQHLYWPGDAVGVEPISGAGSVFFKALGGKVAPG